MNRVSPYRMALGEFFFGKISHTKWRLALLVIVLCDFLSSKHLQKRQLESASVLQNQRSNQRSHPVHVYVDEDRFGDPFSTKIVWGRPF